MITKIINMIPYVVKRAQGIFNEKEGQLTKTLHVYLDKYTIVQIIFSIKTIKFEQCTK